MTDILIIDDDEDQLTILDDYFKVKDHSLAPITHHLENNDGINTGFFTEEKQVERLINLLKEKWDKFGIFLIDMLLLDNTDQDNPVSQLGISSLMSEEKYKDSILKKEKFVFIITAKNTMISGLKLDEAPINGNVRFLYKPTWTVGLVTDGAENKKQNCTCSDICDKNKENNTSCSRNDCLYSVVLSIKNRKENG